jgi:hypothetical protein
MEQIETTREFCKHKVFGDIYAVETVLLDGKRSTLAARKCVRPEEMTAGALPVLTLHSIGDALEFVAKHRVDFDTWEAPKVREELVAAATDAMKERDDAAGRYNKIRKDERAAQKEVEKLDEKVRIAVRALNAPPAEAPPLLAIAEGSNTAPTMDPHALTPEEFDEAFRDSTGTTGMGEVPDPQDPDFYNRPPGDDTAPSTDAL